MPVKTRTLYVPTNVSLRNEVWKGLSVKDALLSLLVTVIAAGVAVFFALVLGAEQIWCVLGVLIVAAICITLLQKFESNLSMMDYIKIALKYAKEQKRFLYVYKR